MAKSAKLLLIGALALLFSVAVLLENGAPVDAPDAITANALPSELSPSVSSSSTDVVDHIPKEEPKAIIEVGLAPAPQIRKENEEDTEGVEETSIEELLENRPPPEPVIEEASLWEGEREETVEEKELPLPPEPDEKSMVYIVQKNDSFWKIAQKVWGKGSEWKKIWEANRDVCPRPDSIRPGLKLTIPEEGNKKMSVAISSSRRETSDVKVPVPGRYYIVQKGDVLSIIAQKAYGRALLWRKILNANRDVLPDEWSLRPGMKLFIPRLR